MQETLREHDDIELTLKMLNKVRSLPITYETVQESDGSFTGRTLEFGDIENAPDIEKLKIKLVKGMKDWARVLADDYTNWSRGREVQVPYLVKILFSTEEELLTCLTGKN